MKNLKIIKNNDSSHVGKPHRIDILNNKMIEKAKTISDAKKKLRRLAGKKHHIYSSAAAYFNNKLVWKTTQKTIVKVRSLNRKEIDEYLKKMNSYNFLSLN